MCAAPWWGGVSPSSVAEQAAAVRSPRTGLATHLRASGRALRMLGHVARGLAIVAWRFPRLSQDQQQAQVQAWAEQLLRHAGISVRLRGQPAAQGPVLMVANHISWLDIPVLHAARHCRFVSKSDVKSWPLVGMLASSAGTLYIERHSRRDARRMVQTMADALRAGDILAVFPEGTTGDGRSILPFHANLLQAAIEADAPIQPVALKFTDARTGAVSHAPSYVGDETLLGSIWRTLGAPALVAEVHYGALEQAQGRDRRAWAQDLEQTVAALRD